jgi:cell wall-associated NlpC family hydrolase
VASLALAALVSSGTGAWATDASASTGSGATSPSESSLQGQAELLAGQIDADGRTLDQLSEQLDAAQIRSQQLTSQLQVLRTGIARTHTKVVTDRTQLRKEALVAYVTGGAPIADDIPPGQTGTDPSLAVSYSEIVAANERRVLLSYETALDEQNRQSAQLTEALQQSSAVVVELRADQAAAAKAYADRQTTLALVKGQLATLVARVQSQRQRAEQSSLGAKLAGQGQALPSGSALRSAPAVASGSSASKGRGSSPANTSGSPVTTRTTSGRSSGTSRPPSATTPPAPPSTRPTTRATPPTTRPAPPPTTRPPTPPATPAPTAPPTTRPAPPPVGSRASGWSRAIAYAYAQLGKPYQWGGAGPGSFDCSGLVMMAWAAGGVYFPHLAQDQYDLTERIPLGDALPGDLIFYGTPSDVYHVGIYIGGGEMIDAPETGQNVSISSIYWSGLLGAGRVVG